MSEHIPVLLQPTIDNLLSDLDGIYIDLTFGRGGHSKQILQQLSSKGRLIALDQDPQAIASAQIIDDPRFEIYHLAFENLLLLSQQLGIVGQVTGILADIGTSSPQLDQADRGFSFMRNGKLDMRMSGEGETARDWLLTHSEQEIAHVLWNYGEEKYSRRIAREIKQRQQQAINDGTINQYLLTTLDLSNLISTLVPREAKKHPATRSFQAIRIVLNRELDQLKTMLQQSLSVLQENGRLAIITFHSLEDRIVKNFMRDQYQGEQLPRGIILREDQWDPKSYFNKPYKAITADKQEINTNPRSRSATLRVAVRNGRPFKLN